MSVNAWQRFLDGDDASFSELYRHYFNELFAYGLKIGFDDELCKDAIQDVFYKLFTSKDRLSHVQNIEFYLLQSLKNRLYDIYSGEIKINPLNYDDTIQDNENSIIEKIIEKETRLHLEDKIKQSLNILPPKQRKIIYWHYHLNLSFVEIASLLEVKPDAVRKSVYRALQKMKESRELRAISFLPLPIILTLIG